MAVTEKDVRDALKGVKDPELGLDLVVLGLVYDIEVQESGVKVLISLTSPMCPVAGQIVEARRHAKDERVDGGDGDGERSRRARAAASIWGLWSRPTTSTS